MEAAAARTGLSRASVSRIESAKQTILPRNVRLLCQAYGVNDTTTGALVESAEQSEGQGWWLDYGAQMPNWAGRFAGEEGEASTIWNYEAEHVPGLLQTAGYCRAITAAHRPDVPADELDRAVELRLARQRVFAGGRARLHAVVNEGALRRLVGGAAVMREQLAHLREVVERPTTTFQVLPFSAGAHPAMTAAFVVLHFSDPGAEPTIFVEIDGGAVYPDDLGRYSWMWNRLVDLSLSERESTVLLDTLAKEL